MGDRQDYQQCHKGTRMKKMETNKQREDVGIGK